MSKKIKQILSFNFKIFPARVLIPVMLYWFSPELASAQLTVTERVTFELNSSDNDEFNVLGFKEKGVLVVNTKANNFGRDLEMHFVKFDTTLTKTWDNSYSPGFLFRMVKYFETSDHLFCLFRKDESRDILILRLDIVTGDYVVTDTELLTSMDIDLFTVIKSKVLIGGRYNDRPVVELVNLFSKSAKVLPEIHSNNIKLNNIEVNEQEELVYILLKNSRNCKLLLKVYDYEGKIVGKETLGEKNKLPLNGKIVKIPNGDFVLTGNYADNCTDYSVGFYIHSLSREDETLYYDFVELDNFLSYMNDKRQTRVKNRIKKKNSKGKEFKLRQRLIIQDPIKVDSGMIMLAEVFYPEYKNYSSTMYPIGRNYRWSANNYYSFNNFRYTHALILKFNNKGALEWDQSISLNDLQSRTLDHKIQISSVPGGHYVVAYPDEGIIKNTVLDGTNHSKEDIPLKLQAAEDNVLDTFQSELSSWYSHSFLSYGIQSIRTPGTVYPKDFFYLNKIVYR